MGSHRSSFRWPSGSVRSWLLRNTAPVRRSLSSTASNLTVLLSGYWPAAALTTAQAVIMMLVLQFAWDCSQCERACCSMCLDFSCLGVHGIMQFLSGSMGTAGKFLAVVLLMLQLTSAAGTFPLERCLTSSRQSIRILPMTYVVCWIAPSDNHWRHSPRGPAMVSGVYSRSGVVAMAAHVSDGMRPASVDHGTPQNQNSTI
jgi:hypothetical protein